MTMLFSGSKIHQKAQFLYEPHSSDVQVGVVLSRCTCMRTEVYRTVEEHTAEIADVIQLCPTVAQWTKGAR